MARMNEVDGVNDDVDKNYDNENVDENDENENVDETNGYQTDEDEFEEIGVHRMQLELR